MKSKKTLIYLLLLLLIAAGLAWQFYFKKKSGSVKPKKPVQPVSTAPTQPSAPKPPTQAPAAVATQKPAPQPQSAIETNEGEIPAAPPVSSPPTLATPASPATPNSPIPSTTPPAPSQPQPTAPVGTPPTSSAPVSQVVPPATSTTPTVPSASGQTPFQIQLPAPVEIAEGSSFFVEGLNVTHPENKTIQYQWSVKEGPADKIILEDAQSPKPLVRLKAIEEPATFQLELKLSDGENQSVQSLSLKAHPAQLKKQASSGGAFMQVEALAGQWVTLRSLQLEVYSANLIPTGTLPLDFTATQIFTLPNVGAPGTNAIYLRDSQSNWWIAEQNLTELQKFSLRRLPMLGTKIRKIFPFSLDKIPHGLALLEKSVELWNFAEPLKPKLKSSVRIPMENPVQAVLQGQHLFVASEENLTSVEIASSRLIATIPTGGSVTALNTVAVGNKNFLIMTLGQDRTSQGRKDYGLKIFEILSGGRLGPESRTSIMQGASVEEAQVLPERPQVLLSAFKEGRSELLVWDLAQQKPLPLTFKDTSPLLAAREFSVKTSEGVLQLAAADGAELRTFKLQPLGNPLAGYQVEQAYHTSGIMEALWSFVESASGSLWTGDGGTTTGGSLAQLSAQDLKVQSDWQDPGLFPEAGFFFPFKPENPAGGLALLLPSSPPEQLHAKALGSLAWIESGAAKPVTFTKPFLGGGPATAAGTSLGLCAQNDSEALRIAVAFTRPTAPLPGTEPTAGLALWRKDPKQTMADFLQSDLLATMDWIPLPEARDVALSLDGKAAFVASGEEGVTVLDLKERQSVQRLSLGSTDWVGDRLLLSNNGQLLLVSFVQKSTRQGIVKIFGIQENAQLQEYSTITGLIALETTEGLRVPGISLTRDDLYILAPLDGNRLGVFNLSDPADPLLIAEGEAGGLIRSVSVGNDFKDIFLSLGSQGVERWEFGF